MLASDRITRKSETVLHHSELKAALINIFILAIDQMTTCNVKHVTHHGKPTENDHPTAVPLNSTGRFSIFQLIVLVFPAHNFTILYQSYCSHW